MDLPVIIGLCGAKYHGKDTTAVQIKKLFEQQYPKNLIERYAFADALKASASAAFGLPLERFHSPLYKEEPVPGYPDWTYRKVLEHMGTEWFRSLFPDIWVRNVCNQITEATRLDPKSCAVITDVRFVDEAERLSRLAIAQSKAFYLVEVIDPRRPQLPDVQSCITMDLHPSMWNYKFLPGRNLLVNDGTVAELFVKLHVQMPQWKIYRSDDHGK